MNSSPETCNNNIMKRILLAACLLMTVACNSKTSTAMQTTTEPVFRTGCTRIRQFYRRSMASYAVGRTRIRLPNLQCHFRPFDPQLLASACRGTNLALHRRNRILSGTRRSGTPFNPRRRGKYPGRDDSLARCGAGQPFHAYRDYSGSESKPSRMAR